MPRLQELNLSLGNDQALFIGMGEITATLLLEVSYCRGVNAREFT
ncbi:MULTISPECIES: hypothetical protein [unclassified Moorena]|nr:MULTISPECIES: hypothetical protein [unclassified Moorena]